MLDEVIPGRLPFACSISRARSQAGGSAERSWSLLILNALIGQGCAFFNLQMHEAPENVGSGPRAATPRHPGYAVR